jgi:hypothetical protein
VPPPSPTRARRLLSLALIAAVSHPVLAADVARRRRVRVRARVRTNNVALAQVCTPTRARLNPGGEAGPLAPFLAPDLEVALLSAAPPWPRRGWLPRARGRREGSATLLTGECTLRHRPPLPLTRVCAQLRSSCPPPPMAPARAPPRLPFSTSARPKPVSLTPTCMRTQAHALARTSRASWPERAPAPSAEYHRCADIAAPTPATASPRRPPTTVLAPFEPSNPKEFQVVAPCWPDAQAPWDSSPARSFRAAVSLVDIWSSTWDR